jgi:hypothetical protein
MRFDLTYMQNDINNRPIAEFEGLSANEIRALINNPFKPDCVVRFNNNLSQETLKQIPILNLLLLFLDKIKSGKYSLTKNGYLSTNLVKELYSAGYISEYMIDKGITKLYNEESSMTIQLIHILSKVSGYVIKRNDKLVLTKRGKALIENPENLVIDLFLNHAFKFNHGYFDLYPDSPAGSTDIGYTLYLLDKYGDKEYLTSFYSEKLRIAFPELLLYFEESQLTSRSEEFNNCIHTRVFNRFLFLYGFVSGINSMDTPHHKNKIRKTGIFDNFFAIKK